MWVRATIWDRSIELGVFDHWVITTRPPWKLKHWLDGDLVQVPQERVFQSLRAALAPLGDPEVPALWTELFPYRSWHPASVWDLQQELMRAARGAIPEVVVLERLMERGFRMEPVVWQRPPPPPRTQTEHFIVVEAVDADERPVAGLRLELLIADGEVKSAQTDRDGVARIARVQAGRVVIRVLGIDGQRWRPKDGAPARESTRDRPSTHVVERGENLSRIARRYGLRSWRAIWDDPQNERLRSKRKSPHRLHPGDALHVPGMPIFEIERDTDAAHRIVVETYRFESDLALTLTTQFATCLTAGGFAHWGRAVFGEDIPREGFARLHSDLRHGALPGVQTRLSHGLESHPAAYDTRERGILVAEDIVLEACTDRTGYAATLACVLIEEFGHFLDDLLRHHYAQVGGDAPADEGARFASLLLTEALATAGPLRVGVLFIDGVAHDIVADGEEIAAIVREVIGPIQQRSDERTEGREYADALPGDEERAEILYLGLLLAGYAVLDAHALVDLARKLNARWRGMSGPAVFYETTKPGKPGLALERLLLSYLLALHRELEGRIRAAPLAADGLPDLGETRWSLEEEQPLWQPGSPLAGLLEDIAPFGSHQEWVARFHQLDRDRKSRESRVRQRARQAEPPGKSRTQTEPALHGLLVDAQGISEAASGEAGPTPVDDALNTTDRVVATIDTAISILELVGVEIAGSVVATVAGPVLLLLTFGSGLAKADGQQLAAAKAMGVVFAYFAVKAAGSRELPPPAVTPEDVEREVVGNYELRGLRNNRIKWRGHTPQSVLDEGEKMGIKLVLDAVNANLVGAAQRAQNAYSRMIHEARLDSMGKPEQERLRQEERLRTAYPLPWWVAEIRRRTYAQIVNSIEREALAVFNRFSSAGGQK